MKPVQMIIQSAALSALLLSCLLIDKNGDGKVSVVCLGDSNTMGALGGDFYTWCDGLATNLAPSTLVANEAYLGTSVTCGAPGDWCGLEQLSAALAGTRPAPYGPPFPPADAVIAAFGTNDIALRHQTTQQILDGYQKLVHSAPNRLVLIATTPPLLLQPDNDAKVTELNAAIRAHFPAAQIIDFDTGFRDPMYYGTDGVHMNTLGHQLREQRARQALNSRDPW